MSERFYPDELYHHGILGMKWGVRRYQNADGSLTEAGKRRESKASYKASKKDYKKANRRYNRAVNRYYSTNHPVVKVARMGDMYKAEKDRTAKRNAFIKEKAKYKGITIKKARRGEDIKDGAKIAATLLASVGYLTFNYKMSTDPKFAKKVINTAAQGTYNAVKKGTKVAGKVLDAYGQWKYNHDKSIVDAPGFEVMGEVRNIAGYLKG